MYYVINLAARYKRIEQPTDLMFDGTEGSVFVGLNEFRSNLKNEIRLTMVYLYF